MGEIWRYFTFFNQLISVPVLCCGTIYLAKAKKNYFISLIPAIFYVFITMSFIFSEKIGFNLPLKYAELIAFVISIVVAITIIKQSKECE